MARKGYNYPKEKVLKAIKGSNGNITTVMHNLKCRSWATTYKYINKWSDTREALDTELCSMNDIAREVIQKDIIAGSVSSAKWWLERKCRDEFGDNPPMVETEETDNKLEFVLVDTPLQESTENEEKE